MGDYGLGRGFLDSDENKEKMDQGYRLNGFLGPLSYCCRASG